MEADLAAQESAPSPLLMWPLDTSECFCCDLFRSKEEEGPCGSTTTRQTLTGALAWGTRHERTPDAARRIARRHEIVRRRACSARRQPPIAVGRGPGADGRERRRQVDAREGP